jgi:translation elongation factor EF-G
MRRAAPLPKTKRPSSKRMSSWRAPAAALRSRHLSRRPSDAGLFGSALKNFGVRDLLDALAQHSRRRRAQAAKGRAVEPATRKSPASSSRSRPTWIPTTATASPSCGWLGQVPPRHEAEAIGHRQEIGVTIRSCSSPSERETVDEAWPGDIIGIPNHGVLRVGDTLSESGKIVFTGIPNFAPEILRRVRLGDPMKQKHWPARWKPRRRRRDPGVQADHRLAMDRRRGGRAAARRGERPRATRRLGGGMGWGDG